MTNRLKSALIWLICLSLLYLCSCRSGQKLMQLACDRDPAICKPIQVYKLDAPKVYSDINCDHILRGFEIVKIREYVGLEGETIQDTVRAYIRPNLPSSEVDTIPSANLEIDCPDPVVIERPYPVIQKIGFWDGAKWFAFGFIAASLIFVILRVVKS